MDSYFKNGFMLSRNTCIHYRILCTRLLVGCDDVHIANSGTNRHLGVSGLSSVRRVFRDVVSV
jgi:hypothetical protein